MEVDFIRSIILGCIGGLIGYGLYQLLEFIVVKCYKWWSQWK